MSISGDPSAKPPVLMIAGIFVASFVALVAIAIFYSTSQDRREEEAIALARQSQVDSCNRVNALREETNRVIEVLKRDLEITADIWQDLSEITDDPREVSIELQAAARYREMIDRISFVDIPICEDIIPRYQDITEVVYNAS